MADILLSYERTDRQRVAPLVALLETCGWSVQWEPAGEADTHGLADAACIIAAWSIDSVESEAVWAVASHGLASGILVSVSIDFSQPPQELREAPSLALAGWTGDASSPRAQELLAAVGGLLAHAPERAPKKAPEPAPSRSYAAEAPAPHPTEPAARASVDPPAAPAEPEARKVEVPGASAPDAQWPPVFDPEPEPQWRPAFPRQRETQAGVEVDLDSPAPPPEPVPALIRRDGATEPVWAFPEETEEDEERTPRLPPVLLRERGLHFRSPEEEVPAPPSAARRSLAGPVIGLVAGLAIVAAAGAFWMTEWLAPPPPRGGETAAVKTAEPESKSAAKSTAKSAAPESVAALAPPVRPQEPHPPEAKPPEAKPPEATPPEAKPQEVQPTPAALPKEKDVAIEDILGQVTPRAEQLLADARTLIRIGDFRGARQVLAAPETARSGSLTFLLAETYDPNVLPAAQKGTFADPGRARALYRKARDLGDGRAQARLDALKTS